jgi:mRNA interferase YafQ
MPKRKLVISKSFEKAYLKFVNKKPFLKYAISETLVNLEDDSFSTNLKTHKLSGKLLGVYACSCGYDCRIVFTIEKDKSTQQEYILLVDIGTHDDVY